MDKRFFRRCARNAAFSLLGCLLLAAPAFAAQEITVSGAASLTNAFTEIKGLFEKKYPDIKVHTNFAASNPLLKQMEEGAPVDVFASADQETMDKAAAKKLVDTATRKDFALNDRHGRSFRQQAQPERGRGSDQARSQAHRRGESRLRPRRPLHQGGPDGRRPLENLAAPSMFSARASVRLWIMWAVARSTPVSFTAPTPGRAATR